MQRNYTIPMVGVITVDADKGTVEVEVDLTDLSFDLKYDYDHPHPDAQTKRDQEIITACLMETPLNFSMKHTMSTEAPK
jgi:hypothetical protein